MAIFYYTIDSREFGPVNEAVLKNMVQNGKLQGNDAVRKAGTQKKLLVRDLPWMLFDEISKHGSGMNAHSSMLAQASANTRSVEHEYVVKRKAKALYKKATRKLKQSPFNTKTALISGCTVILITIVIFGFWIAYHRWSVRFRLIQRTSTTISTPHGDVTVSIGDITRGQVLLSLTGENDKVLANTSSVRQYDAIVFTIGNAEYTLQVLALHNYLFDEDEALLEIAEGASSNAKRVDTTVVIFQRSSARIPGISEKVIIHIGDIKGDIVPNPEVERVVLSLIGEQGEIILPPTTVQNGSRVPFTVAGKSYVLTITHLQNQFIPGDEDYIAVEVVPK